MQLTPRYDGPPVLRFTGPVGDPAVGLVRQRRRLGALLASLDDDEWQVTSRCDAWSVQDVVAHLATTNQFWVLMVQAALAGEPTRYLERFDPVVTPAQMVDGTRGTAPAAVLEDYLRGVDAIDDALSGLDEEQWSLPTESPPGHVPLHAMAGHAIWDSWIHERDIAVPLGRTQPEEPDQVRACLEYIAALGPAFLATSGSTRRGTLDVRGIDPDVHVVVEVGETVVVDTAPEDGPAGAVRLVGRSVDLLVALRFRGPLPCDVDVDDRWILGGLATVFDRAC